MQKTKIAILIKIGGQNQIQPNVYYIMDAATGADSIVPLFTLKSVGQR